VQFTGSAIGDLDERRNVLFRARAAVPRHRRTGLTESKGILGEMVDENSDLKNGRDIFRREIRRMGQMTLTLRKFAKIFYSGAKKISLACR